MLLKISGVYSFELSIGNNLTNWTLIVAHLLIHKQNLGFQDWAKMHPLELNNLSRPVNTPWEGLE